MRGAIAAHDFSAAPLFLVWAPHIVHTAPNDALEAPQAALDKFAFVDDPYRRAYAAMVNLLDSMQVRIPKPPPHRHAPPLTHSTHAPWSLGNSSRASAGRRRSWPTFARSRGCGNRRFGSR